MLRPIIKNSSKIARWLLDLKASHPEKSEGEREARARQTAVDLGGWGVGVKLSFKQL